MTIILAIVFAALAVTIGAIVFFTLRSSKSREVSTPVIPAPAVQPDGASKAHIDESASSHNGYADSKAEVSQPSQPHHAEIHEQPSEPAAISTKTNHPEPAAIPEEPFPTITAHNPRDADLVKDRSRIRTDDTPKPSFEGTSDEIIPIADSKDQPADDVAAASEQPLMRGPAPIVVDEPEPAQISDAVIPVITPVTSPQPTEESISSSHTDPPAVLEEPVSIVDAASPPEPRPTEVQNEIRIAETASTSFETTAGDASPLAISANQLANHVSAPSEQPPTKELAPLIVDEPEPPQYHKVGSPIITPPPGPRPAEDSNSSSVHSDRPEAVNTDVANETAEDIISNGAEIESPAFDENSSKRVQRYRPPTPAAPRAKKERNPNRPIASPNTAEVQLEIRLRMTFDRFRLCGLALLPARKPDLDDEIIVKFRGESLSLAAQEDWYQDLQFHDLGNLLNDAIELKGKLADGKPIRWLLTARPIFVLASHEKASGFVQTNRMALGRTHVVMFTAAMQSQVEEILRQAGCSNYERLGEAEGIPTGWIAFKNAVPANALALDTGEDPFYAIKPAPDVQIDLVGGIFLYNAVWLAGYPPRIKLNGEAGIPFKVLIDGKEALTNSEGFLEVEGYDSPGQHSVHCEGLACSRTYAIEEPREDWPAWPAHNFGQSEICGPLVIASKKITGRPVTVPMSTPVLLGAEPGQIFRCSHRNVSNWKGYVPFEVVWALPAHPLQSNKKTARILQFKNAPFLAKKNHKDKATLDWCKAILDASRKGLKVDNSHGETVQWHQYKKEARKIWRAAK